MSKVIKTAIRQGEARTIAAPPPLPPPKPAPKEELTLSEDQQNKIVAKIRAQEKRAKEILSDAKISVQVMKQEAKAKSDKMIAEAKKDAEQIRKIAQQEGHDQGFSKGHEEGEATIRQELDQQIKDAGAKATKILEDAKKATRDYLQGAEKEIVSIAMEAVEKVLPEHLIDENQLVLPIVQRALLRVKDQKELKIRVSAECFDIVLMNRDEFRKLLTAPDATLEVASDESLSPGDCVIETPNGSVDARLQTQIELIRQAVKDVML